MKKTSGLKAVIDKPWLKCDDISEELGIHVKTIKLMIKSGRGPVAYQFGSHIRIKKEDYENWVSICKPSELKKISPKVMKKDVEMKEMKEGHPSQKQE